MLGRFFALFPVLGACAMSHAAPVPASASVRYLALGDSFTIGTGSTPDRAFPSRMVMRWRMCPIELRNVAVNGYTTEDVIEEELPELRRFAPTFVTLAIGANDIVRGTSPDTYRQRVRRILERIAAAGVRAIVALPQPDWSTSPAAEAFGSVSEMHGRIVEFNAVLREETVAVGGVFVDLFPLMQTQARARMIAGDGLHPSEEAYDAWALELTREVTSPCSAP
jgi:acyl-CoA thioesterase-1